MQVKRQETATFAQCYPRLVAAEQDLLRLWGGEGEVGDFHHALSLHGRFAQRSSPFAVGFATLLLSEPQVPLHLLDGQVSWLRTLEREVRELCVEPKVQGDHRTPFTQLNVTALPCQGAARFRNPSESQGRRVERTADTGDLGALAGRQCGLHSAVDLPAHALCPQHTREQRPQGGQVHLSELDLGVEGKRRESQAALPDQRALAQARVKV